MINIPAALFAIRNVIILLREAMGVSNINV